MSNLCSKCINHSSIAERHQDQWQCVSEYEVERSNCLLSRKGHVGGIAFAGSMHDVSTNSGERYLECWHNDPDKHD